MLLVSSGNDLKFHSTVQYETVQSYRPTNSSGLHRSISWCRDGTLLSLVPFKGNAEILRTKDDVKIIQSIMGISAPTATAFQHTTKKNIALGTMAGNILVYDIKARSTKKMFSKSGAPIMMLDWNYKDTHLAVLNSDGEVSIYSNLTNQKTGSVQMGSTHAMSAIRYHQSHKNLLACANDEGAVCVWDNNTGKNKFFSQVHKAPVTDLVFSSQNNSLLISVALDRSFHCYDTNNGDVALTILTDQPLSAIDMAPNGHTIAVASIRGIIYIYDLRQYSTPLKTIQAHDGEIKRIFYQPQESGSTESVNIPEETLVVDTEPLQKNSSIDSFAQMVNSINEFSPRVELSEQKSGILKRHLEVLGDSFLADLSPQKSAVESYLGDKTNELSNLGITDGVKKWINSKNNLMDTSIPHNSVIVELQKELSSMLTVQSSNNKSSTPKINNKVCYIQDENIQNSPIVLDSTIKSVNMDEILKVFKDVVSEVTRYQRNEFMEVLNRYYLNLQMSFSKQYVKQEADFRKLMNTQPNHSNLISQIELLKEENEFLKKKLNEKWKIGDN